VHDSAVGVGGDVQVAEAELAERPRLQPRDGSWVACLGLPLEACRQAVEELLVADPDRLWKLDPTPRRPLAALSRQHRQVGAGQDQGHRVDAAVRTTDAAAPVPRGPAVSVDHVDAEQPPITVVPAQQAAAVGSVPAELQASGDLGVAELENESEVRRDR
jgi:hypothetical protein